MADDDDDTPDVTSPRVSLTPQEPHGWRPITTAPKDGTRVLVYRAHEPGYEHDRIDVDLWLNGVWWCSRRAMQPTHWMPLPPPPAKEPRP